MTYLVVFSELAEKQFSKLPREIQQKIISVLDRIKIRPEAYITKLVGEDGYKLRAGDYRVIIDIKHAELQLLVIKVGHRKNIYN